MRYLIILLLCLLVGSCEKDITIQLDPSLSRLVVDATIENGRPPMVFLSKSLDYFSKIDPAVLSSSFVHNAKVRISDGSTDVLLKEDSIKNSTGTKIYFYTIAGQSLPFLGKLKSSYSITIEADGKVYNAKTTIPEITRKIDSLWWEKVPLAKDSNRVKVVVRATDKPGLGDYIRFFTKVGQQPFLPGFNSVFDDQVIDGQQYTIPVDKGFDKNAQFSDSTSYFKRGDTVMIKVCNIDKQTYDFWRTSEFNFQSVGNPFSSPIRILSNINNDALGYFGGYGCQYKTIIIPR
ncbi:MAG: hypothetical protein RIT36_1036 [Bacteroidota bacterium]|jgi:hypothetical protein